MGNGGHTLELVRVENDRVIESMRRRLNGGCGSDPEACISGFERMFDLVEMLFEIVYEKKPQETTYKVFVPKSFKEALLVAATKSPWAIAAVAAIALVYSIHFNKLLPWF